MEDNKTVKDTLKEEVEKLICDITEQGVNEQNIEYLGDLVDIHKDLIQEDKYKEEIEMYRGNYGNYGNYGTDMSYGRGRRRDSRGRYMESSNYGRRGGNYRGHSMLDEMSEHYGRYQEGREQGRRGNYGAKEDSMKALEYMLQSAQEFFMMLFEEAESEEEIEMIKHTARKISEM